MNDVKYPELPKCYSLTTGGDHFNQTSIELFTADQMRSYADATCALRGAQKESAKSLLIRAREFIDTTQVPAYPKGADLADEIDAWLSSEGEAK